MVVWPGYTSLEGYPKLLYIVATFQESELQPMKAIQASACVIFAIMVFSVSITYLNGGKMKI